MEESDCLEFAVDLNVLLDKELDGSLSMDDFYKTWTELVMFPLYRLEYIIKMSSHTIVGYTSDQAVIYGLLVQMYKLICTDRRLTCTRENTHEIASVLQRMLFELNVTIQYLINNPDRIDDYRKSSIKGDKKFYDMILQNRKERGDSDSELYLWEERILSSINRSFDEADYKPNDTIPKFPNMLDRMKGIGAGNQYYAYSTSSDVIHNGWSHIVKYSLTKQNDRYYPDFTDYAEDIRLLNPILIFCYETLKLFFSSYPGHNISGITYIDLENDQKMIMMFDKMHHNFLNHNALSNGIEDFLN